jgi:phosphopantothenoylcysteine decarboxylase / phosphopantothenate---cysteine ligase
VNNKIILGVTGGIAVYKIVDLASRLSKAGNQVYVVMTEESKKFVSPLTFQAITHNPVETDLFSSTIDYDVKHIRLSELADIILVAPATANFIAKIAHGFADDLLSAILMATRTPVLISPSMNVHMYENPIFQDNLNYLCKKGFKIIEPASGYLACGDTGKGRLPESVELEEHILKALTLKDLKGKRILITAGPTREALDPVRFITNYSSGKMGYALAREASYRGAEVLLISGPVNLIPPLGVKSIMVEKAEDMYKIVRSNSENQDIIIMAAAVSDYRPVKEEENKIKKRNYELKLLLKSNPDILASLGKDKKEGQILVGFAAESRDLIENARLKMKNKNLDMIIVNDIKKADSGFISDNNEVKILKNDEIRELPLMKKEILANIIFDEILNIIGK